MRVFFLFLTAVAAQPAVPAPRPALLWTCGAGAPGAQSWTAPSKNSTLALTATPSLLLTVLGWPAFARNTPILSAGAAPIATFFAFVNGSLITATGSGAYAPPGACVAPLYGVPFHGAALGTVPCGSTSPTWAYTASDGALRFGGSNSSLCLDWGSSFTCAGPEGAGIPYCNPALAPAARAADLVARLSAAEMSALLSSNSIVQPLNYGTNMGLPARGVPPMWFSECCHGAVARCGEPGAAGGSGCPTSLPAGLSTGASLNRTAWAAAGLVVSTEARALYNQGLHGLGCFAPNVNPFRAPQWGRGAEVVSEDSFINGEFGVHFTTALQGRGDASVLRVLATLKHGTA